jgi:hypothetical protein
MQTRAVPEMTAGRAFTVSVRVAKQPVDVNLKVMVAVPAATPVTEPLAEPMVAMELSLLLQVPPLPSVRVADEPAQMAPVPDMAPGTVLTIVRVVVLHPVVGNV